MVAKCLGRADAALDRKAVITAVGGALPRDQRVGIVDGIDQPPDAGGDDRLAAWWRTSVMAAGLERDVERGAACGLAGLCQSDDLAMRPAAIARAATPHDDPVAHDEGADAGVWRRTSHAATAQRQRCRHEAHIGIAPARVAVSRRMSAHARLGAGLGLPRPGSSSG